MAQDGRSSLLRVCFGRYAEQSATAISPQGLLRWSVGGSGVAVPGSVPDSEAGRELGERDSNWIMVGQVGDEFVVATAQVLD